MEFIKFTTRWIAGNLSVPFWMVGHVHLSTNVYQDLHELVASFGMNAVVAAGFYLEWKQHKSTIKDVKKPTEIPFEVAVPLMYYINDDGKYIFDDEEMHATLDEKLNEISLTINGLDLRSLN